MGYCVSMNLEGVEIPHKNVEQAKTILKELNEGWQRSHDWCRFSDSDDLLEIIEDIGFECGENDTHVYIEDFNREKMGDHINMFKGLAPVLDDCTIKIYGEDGSKWKLEIKDHFFTEQYIDADEF